MDNTIMLENQAGHPPPPASESKAQSADSSPDLHDPSGLLLSIIRKAKFNMLNIKEIAQIATQDPTIRIARAEDHLPSNMITWGIVRSQKDEPDLLLVPESKFRDETGTSILGRLFHEVIAGHRKFTSFDGMPNKYNLNVNQTLFMLMEGFEDPWVDYQTIKEYPQARELRMEARTDYYDPSDKDVEETASQPLHIQYVFNLLYRFAQTVKDEKLAIIPHHPAVTDQRVIDLTEKTWGAFQRTLAVPINPKDNSKKAWKEALTQNALARYKIIQEEVEADYLKLVEEAKKEFQDRKKQQPQDQGQGEKDGDQNGQPQDGSGGPQEQGEPKDQDSNDSDQQQENGKQGKKDKKKSQGKPKGQSKPEQGIDKETEDQISQMEKDLINQLAPKLKEITPEEFEQAQKLKAEEDAQKKEQEEQLMQQVRDLLKNLTTPQTEMDPKTKAEMERRLAVYNQILRLDETQEQIANMIDSAAQILTDMQRGMAGQYRRPRDERSGLDDGDFVDESVAHEATWGNPAIMAIIDRLRESGQGKRNYCLTWVIDVSGSERSECPNPNPKLPDKMKITNLLQGLIVGIESAAILNVPQQVVAFNGKLYTLLDWGEMLNDETRARIAAVRDLVGNSYSGYNNDGYALTAMTNRETWHDDLMKPEGQGPITNFERGEQTGEKKLVVFMADGLPAPDHEHSGPEYDLQTVIDKISNEALAELIGLGIGQGTEHIEEFFRSDAARPGFRTGKYMPDIGQFAPVVSQLLLERLFGITLAPVEQPSASDQTKSEKPQAKKKK